MKFWKTAATAIFLTLVFSVALVSFASCGEEEVVDDAPFRYQKKWSADLAFDESECVELEKEAGKPFRILQLTDVHYDDHNDKKEGTLALIKAMIEESRPDLIALTGDWVSTSKAGEREARSRAVFDTIESYQIPWAPVFGNHDAEGELTKYDYADIFKEYPHCVFRAGYSNIKGVGNYIVTVKENGALSRAIYFLDSHTALEKGSAKYDCIGKRQIEWYEWAAEGLGQIYSRGGNTNLFPSLAFFHIPLNEYGEYKNAAGSEALLLGGNREKVSSPYRNSGFFAAAKRRGTAGIFAGHDHDNNAAIVKDGVTLGYGVQSGWCADYATGSQKGALVIDFDASGKLYLTHNYFDMARYPSDKT